ncbi:MAG: hypothetical protein ACXVB1_06865 [Pseudobdellovibrionaceae bacterium]
MKLQILGASTLKHFTESIIEGFLEVGVEIVDQSFVDFSLIQIHGSPAARAEDEKIIEASGSSKEPKAYLIHRPDEVLLHPPFKTFFESRPTAKIIFLGDLIFRFPFWADRRAFCSVIPHPYLDFSMPAPARKPILGAFTSWGEMRDIKHYLSLVECLKGTEIFDFRIGGTGLDEARLPDHIQFVREPFTPHFNVQLYHLLGKKRYGESSGSLHRGISIPVIFEANGAERLEGLKAVKVEADDELKSIKFEKAATEILSLATAGIDPLLQFNREAAQLNSVRAFAKSVTDFLRTTPQRR